jgi:putative ABC transport system substrate-binding protein
VPDASAALMSRDIDAVLQIPGNLTASAFGSINEAARRTRIPVFAFQKSQAIGGAMVVVARDYKDSGRHAAHLAARIMRGENPKGIPLEDFAKTSLIVNLDAARSLGITIPPSLVRSAKDVIGNANGNR